MTLHQLEECHNLDSEEAWTQDYRTSRAPVLAQFIIEMREKVQEEGASFAQQYMLQRGLKEFGKSGADAAQKELDQLHQRNCFQPIDISNMSPSEKKKAQQALMFLTEKRDGSIKGRMVYNGKPTREWMSKEDNASPTASLESIFLTAAIDAKEGRDIMTADIPNAFIQANMPPVGEGEDRVIMKITGALVALLVELDPTTYAPFVIFEKGKQVLYVEVLKGLYGMLIASLLWYNKFRGDLEGIAFVFNSYDPCVANRMLTEDKTDKIIQQTIRIHVDDTMSSVMDPLIHDLFYLWLNKMYGKHSEVKALRGKTHDYLGMTFNFTEPGKVIVDMTKYVADMLEDFSLKLKPSEIAPTPALDDLLTVGIGPPLDKKQQEEFHTFVAKGLFLCKRARPDTHPTIAVLCTRVHQPNQADWRKLVRYMKYLNGTRDLVLTLSVDSLTTVNWYVDASFAVHPDFKSHTGAVMTYGTGAVQSLSRKQRLNTRSSTEAELVGVDDAINHILWTKLFLEDQGYPITENRLAQDNMSSILLEKNGKKSSSGRTRAINIRYFFVTDQVEKGNVMIYHCPTDDMIADFMTKPLQGKKFLHFRNLILGSPSSH